MLTLKLISIYYHVCDIYNALLKWNVQRFSINQTQGQITDEEIICIYLFCVANEERYTVKSIYNCILNHWSSWFPNLPSYQAFNQRLNRLAPCFPLLVEAFIQMLELPEDSLPIVFGDSMPIITCSAKRIGKVAPEITDKGYCATKDLYYYGVKLNVLAHKVPKSLPIPNKIVVSPASVHDLTALKESILDFSHTLIVMDRAYVDCQLSNILLDNQLYVLTPFKHHKKPIVLKQFDQACYDIRARFVAKLRQPIESFFNWINEKTQIQTASKVRSKNGLMIHIFGKIAAAFTILLNY